eukprot:218716-Alexandrium_andersonii.AAC.1
MERPSRKGARPRVLSQQPRSLAAVSLVCPWLPREAHEEHVSRARPSGQASKLARRPPGGCLRLSRRRRRLWLAFNS